jgi:hypothetical protein
MSPQSPAPEALLLVVVMNDPRDFDIARLLGWYRIPLRSAPKVVAVDYLAFYQTAAFGEDKWQIRNIAPVRGVELARRAELIQDEPDHPRANQEYYKIQIGSLIPINPPIRTGDWKRITFLYTTGEYFNHAAILNDLVVTSDERRLLWQSLRERSAQTAYVTDEADELDIDPQVLAALLGITNQSDY